MSREDGDQKIGIPRREFLKQSSFLTGTAAYAITLTTDAKARAEVEIPTSGGPGNTNYQYWGEDP